MEDQIRLLLSGLAELLERHWFVLERHHQEQMTELNKIGNELQFICEEMEDKQPRDLMEGVL